MAVARYRRASEDVSAEAARRALARSRRKKTGADFRPVDTLLNDERIIASYCALSRRPTRNAQKHAALRSGGKALAPVPETYLVLNSHMAWVQTAFSPSGLGDAHF
jgi:hypothetical protein